ncbi:hypothetical protein [Ensifer aridi]|uniref:hypothetical protein n=1 Tax=Ensifer aridi TaxID=1708715 RepID=UPI001557FEDC|nr:hypothetical protein [Ensifer aridi]
MIPGSLDAGERLNIRGAFQAFKVWVRRYFWLWIAYQIVKGIITTTIVWAPLAYLYLGK